MPLTNTALAQARAAFDALPRDAFTELMAYHKPPEALALVCSSALLAVGMPVEHGWVDVQRGIISNPAKFKSEVLALEPVDIDPSRRATLSDHLATLAKADMRKVSNLGAVLEAWLKVVV